MGVKTGIQWCDTTVNPTTGCDGCELWHRVERGPCYAGALHETRLAVSMPGLYAPTFIEVRLAPGRMAKVARLPDLTGTRRPDKPWLDGRPRIIFVGDMGDIFSRGVPFDYLESELIDVASSSPGNRHIYMVLTKQATRMVRFWKHLKNRGKAWPRNIWPGVSITSSKTLGRVSQLVDIPSEHRFVSVEPILEHIDLCTWLFCGRCEDPQIPCGRGAYETPLDNTAGGCWFRECGCEQLALVIVGGESDQGKHRARGCRIADIRFLRDQCKDAGVAFFVKQLGSFPLDDNAVPGGLKLGLHDHHGGDMTEWPEDLRIREFPQ